MVEQSKSNNSKVEQVKQSQKPDLNKIRKALLSLRKLATGLPQIDAVVVVRENRDRELD